jgi:hypothetical protein
MMKFYKLTYGCYLDTVETALKSDLPKNEIDDAVYQMAIESTEGWLGMHGFECCGPDEDFGDCCHQTIDQAAEYYVEECTEEEATEWAELHHGWENW